MSPLAFRILVCFTLPALLACAHPQGAHTARANDDALHGDTLYRAGVQLLDAGDLTRAEQYLSASLRAGHDADSTIKALMTTCVRAGRLRSALNYARPHIADHPDNLGLRLLVASLHLGLDELERAREQLSYLLRVAPTTPEAHYLSAQLLLKQGGDPRAIAQHFRSYVELLPEGPHAEEARSLLETDKLLANRKVR